MEAWTPSHHNRIQYNTPALICFTQPTFLLFPALALVADLDCAHWQDDGHYEEEYASNHASCDGLMLHSGGNRELHLLAALVALHGVRQYAEVVRSTSHQVFHCRSTSFFLLLFLSTLSRNRNLEKISK